MFTATFRAKFLTIRVLLSLCLGATLGLAAQTAIAQGNSGEHGKSAEQLVYEDDHLFEQLSGAARTRAEHKYGRKFHGKRKAPPLSEDAIGTDGDFSDGMWARNVSPFNALPNPLVNDPTTDRTDQDTQSETTLILAGGSNVVCGF